MKYELEYIEKIAKIIEDKQLSEITLKDGEKAITIKKDSYAGNVKNEIAIASKENIPSTPAGIIKEEKNSPKVNAVTSPMVGAFYASPSPGSQPFVKVGDTVAAGQVVCIIEAMKLMNEIETEVSGKVTQICVEDGQSVEYGQVLMYIE